MRMKGETVDELVGFARAMRRDGRAGRARTCRGEPLLDTCGTGGDGAGTFNISTVAAFVVAGAGVRVAKHGNRSISEPSAAARTCWSPWASASRLRRREPARAIREVGIGFLFAPARAYRHEARPPGARRSEDAHGFQPAWPADQPGGGERSAGGRARSPEAAELMAGALAALGLRRGFVVHGSDGLDEITTTGPTLVFEIREGAVERRTLEPDDFAVPVATPADLKGGDTARNLEIANAVLGGAARRRARYRDRQCRRRPGGRGRGRELAGRRRHGRAFRSIAARHGAGWKPWPHFPGRQELAESLEQQLPHSPEAGAIRATGSAISAAMS